MHVLIAGGGVGGLCLAKGLRQAGVAVTVFERDTAIAVREQGYRIHIDADGGEALRRCLPSELFELYLATSTRLGPASVRVLDHRGHELAEFRGRAEFPGGTDGRVHSAVNRLTLREILAHDLDAALRFGAQVTGFVEHDDRVDVRLANGEQVTGDVLVAADGSNSLLRKQFLPDAELIDTGSRCVYGRTPLSAVTVPEPMRYGFTSVTDQRGHAMALGVFDPREPISAPFLTPVTGYLMWAVISQKSRLSRTGTSRWERGEPGALHTLARRVVRRWQPELREFVERAEVGACLAVPLRSSVPVPPWPTGRVTLLGDAIHAMTPAGGKGANTALRDAALLTGQLTEVDRGTLGLRPALADYEARMREYGFAAVTESLRGVEIVG